MANSYHFWETMLRDPSQLGKTIFANEEEPQPGFYRTKQGTPVAIWFDEDDQTLNVIEGDRVVPTERFGAVWTMVLARPVTEEAYTAVRDGGIWPDVDAVVAETIGSNIKDANDPESISEMIDGLAKGAIDYFDRLLADDDEAAKAQSIRARINELSGKADSIREEQKKPHLEAGRRVDATWQPMIKKAADTNTRLRLTLSRYEDWKRQQEAKRIAAEAEARRQQLRADEPLPEAPEPAAPAPSATIKGGYGRAASVRTIEKVTAIDIMKVFPRYIGNADVIALITKLVQKDVDAGITVDGATVETVSNVR